MRNSKVWTTKGCWGTAALLLTSVLVLGGCAFTDQFGKAESTPAEAAVTVTADSTPTPIVVSTPAIAGGSEPGTEDRQLGALSPIYNGEILADRIVPVVAEVAGQVVELNVDVGDNVIAGDQLLRIDSTIPESQHAQAMAALELAQSQLELATTDPEDTDLEAARAGVDAARAAYQRALQGATEEDLRLILSQVRQAEAAVALYQAQYDRIASSPFAGMMPESLQLQQATLGLEAAQAQYDKVLKGATSDVIAGAYAQLTGAEAQLARLEAGAKPAQIKAAKAGVKQAEIAVYLAQLQLEKTIAKAPMDGFVYKLDAVEGGMVAPGVLMVILFSHDVKILIPVEEFRYQEIQVGQLATIRVDAYPDRAFDAVVSSIAPTFNPATRTVQVTVRPTGSDAADLVPGMFAIVELMEQQR